MGSFKINMKLLFGEELRNQLIASFSNAKKVTILSAYFTLPAAKLLVDSLPLSSFGRVIVRARPKDLVSGATDLKAIRYLYENGIPCHIHRTLHAKLYVIDDDTGYVGSANFTSNGLKISGYGNVELSTKIAISERELEIVRIIINDSIFISEEVLERLEDFALDLNTSVFDNCSDWWEDILQNASYKLSEGLFVADLPWCHPSGKNSEEEIAHDSDVFSFGSTIEKVKLSFKHSKVYQFILQKLEQEKVECVFFGTLTEWIHSALRDEVLPYRLDVKGYVVNIYAYFEYYGQEKFIVDRPNYSQRLRIKVNE